MKKRPDLQGIRGFAILCVVLFHFYPDIFKNGYVGVDQFFILSGFLMGQILSRENCLSATVLYSFYYRRFKRLIPLYALFIFSTIIFSLTLFPQSTFDLNLTHLIRAICFISNTKQEDDSLTYDRMVLSAEVLYTHTWSLSVEVQFYIIAPFLLIPPRSISQKMIVFPICFISYSFFTYYLNFDNTKYFAFNSMFTRIWQFLLGAICYNFCSSLSPTLQTTTDDEIPLFEYKGRPSEDISKVSHFLSNLLILSILIVCYYPFELSVHLVRALACCQTFGFIYSGELVPNRLLSSRCAVYLGDISYSLYLIHWPVCAYLKQNHLDTPIGSLFGIICSILLAIIVTETYEKFYLKQEKQTTIIALSIVLYGASLTIIYLSLSQFAPYSPPNIIETGIIPTTNNTIGPKQQSDSFYWRPKQNMTKEEVMAINEAFSKTDTAKLTLNECKYSKFGPPGEKENNYCQVQNDRFTGSKTVLMVGNSYAQNIARMQIHVEECEEKTKEMIIFAKPGCEVLEDSVTYEKLEYCKNWTQIYLQAIIDLQPDYLFITTRHLISMNPNKTDPDEILQFEKRKLVDIEKYVKEKVFIFDALPRPTQKKNTRLINEGIRLGDLVSQESLWDKTADYQLARKRMSILAKECNKCKLLDAMPIFVKNGTFEFYNKKNGIEYFVDGIHFSDYGLDMIRPLYKTICRSL